LTITVNHEVEKLSEVLKLLEVKTIMINRVCGKLYERGLVKTDKEAYKVIAIMSILEELNKLSNGRLKEIMNLMFEYECD
jgi:hypothetical protein